MTYMSGEKAAVRYRIYESVCKTNGAEGALVFGIRAVCPDDMNKRIEFEDISSEYKDVERLKDMLEGEDIDLDQLGYIIEDYVAGL